MAKQRDLSELHRQESAEDEPYRNAHLSDWRPQQESKIEIADDSIKISSDDGRVTEIINADGIEVKLNEQ